MKDLEIEKSVLGALLLDSTVYFDAIELIDRDAFYDSKHRHIYDSIVTVIDGGGEFSPLVVLEHYKKLTGFEFDWLELIQNGSTNAFTEHCLILKEKQLARMQGELAVNLSVKANDPKQDPLETNEYLLNEAERIVNKTVFAKPKTNKELIKAVTDKIDAASQSRGITGIRTGFVELDRIYGGRQNSDLIIKAGRPAMGKTSQALCEAKQMAYEFDKKVAFFSLEMGAEQLMQRLISLHTGIPLFHIRGGSMIEDEWTTYFKEVDYLSKDNLSIIDDVYSLSGIRATAKKMKMRGQLDAIYIDYLQLIEHNVGSRSKENEVSEISRSLKMLAKQLNVPIVALSQLNRSCESRSDKKPMLSDLRDSGAIEQDADIVEFIYRPEYYFPDDVVHLNKAYVIIAKNRHGSCKDVELYFHKECTRFENPRIEEPKQRSVINYHERDDQPF